MMKMTPKATSISPKNTTSDRLPQVNSVRPLAAVSCETSILVS